MAIRDSITIDDALVVLRRALEADPEGMARLMEVRVTCNEALANDPEIQVRSVKKRGVIHEMVDDGEAVEVGAGAEYAVGPMGLLNGLFGIDDRTLYGAIVGKWNLGCPTCKPSKEVMAKAKDLCPVCNRKMRPCVLTGFERVDHSKLPS